MEIYEQTPQKNTSVVTIGDWIITMLLMCLPLVNLILLFVWAFSSGVPVSKANWAKACLIFMLVSFVFIALFWSVIIGTFLAAGY